MVGIYVQSVYDQKLLISCAMLARTFHKCVQVRFMPFHFLLLVLIP
jgi:hypothetical protein